MKREKQPSPAPVKECSTHCDWPNCTLPKCRYKEIDIENVEKIILEQAQEYHYAIKEAIQVLERYDTGEDFAVVSCLRRLRELENKSLTD